MKAFLGIFILALLAATPALIYNAESAQTYPFQDTSLSDDERLNNLISLFVER